MHRRVCVCVKNTRISKHTNIVLYCPVIHIIGGGNDFLPVWFVRRPGKVVEWDCLRPPFLEALLGILSAYVS